MPSPAQGLLPLCPSRLLSRLSHQAGAQQCPGLQRWDRSSPGPGQCVPAAKESHSTAPAPFNHGMMKSARPVQGAAAEQVGLVPRGTSWAAGHRAHHQLCRCVGGEGKLPGVWDTVCSQHGTAPKKCKALGHESHP